MIAFSFLLLIICIVLSITLAIVVSKSIQISSTSIKIGSMAITNTTSNHLPLFFSFYSNILLHHLYMKYLILALIRSNEMCGIQEITPNPTLSRIYGGNEAIPNSWPWVKNRDRHRAGLINELHNKRTQNLMKIS
jgi:hypothetical protein